MQRWYKLRPTFWTGDTGRALRKSPGARIVAVYLLSCPTANVYGLYHLALPTVALETGLPLKAVQEAFRELDRIGFASYDPDSQFVWVRQMAAQQLEAPLAPKDYRTTNAQRFYALCPRNAFLGAFWDLYHEGLRLGERRDVQVRPREAPSEGPSSSSSPSPSLVIDDGFDLFWQNYPRKDSKKRAREIWHRLKPTPQLQEEIQAAIERQRGTDAWLKEAGAYIPHASTWLHQERWRDQGTKIPRLTKGTISSMRAAHGFLTNDHEDVLP